MKYPVNVLPEQLLEYFHDMGHLTLDVIDRDTRKQFGECKLPLDLYRDNQVMTMKEKLVALKRDNVLCEIKPSEGQEGEVAGYLAVTFDVQWTESDVKIDDDMGIVEDYLDAEVPVSDWVEVVDSEETKGVFKVESKMIEKEKELKKSRRKDDVENSAHFQRIQKLLEKGKALQQSMERAVTDEKKKDNGEIGEKDEDPVLTNYTVDQPIHRGLPFEPDTVAEFVGSSIQWSKVLTDDARLSNSEPSAESDNDFLPPSISSDSSEVQVKHGGAAGPLLSGYTLDQRLHQEVQQRTQHRTFLRNSSNKYKSFQFAVMFESVSNVKCDNEESHDTECRLESDEQLDQSLGLEHLSEDGAVLGHSLELEDLSSGSDSVPSETVSLPDYNTGEVEIPDSIPSSPKCAPTIQYAEKAVQVNLIEPGLHVEMVACAVQTAPLADSKDECDEIDWDNDVEEAKTTVDVGCDAMEIGGHS
ncbi:DnaJ subfamily B member 5 [Phytophthora nicotianae]|uniref:DnaJ subfamily B member 5 n=1 Tax=Phytophthora nicotianae TaxID=4792 RepID=A0A0W8CSK5_PHYNI|nr:DnaJ subfamily B member 5 [Phytophthora nicotianae]